MRVPFWKVRCPGMTILGESGNQFIIGPAELNLKIERLYLIRTLVFRHDEFAADPRPADPWDPSKDAISFPGAKSFGLMRLSRRLGLLAMTGDMNEVNLL